MRGCSGSLGVLARALRQAQAEPGAAERLVSAGLAGLRATGPGAAPLVPGSDAAAARRLFVALARGGLGCGSGGASAAAAARALQREAQQARVQGACCPLPARGGCAAARAGTLLPAPTCVAFRPLPPARRCRSPAPCLQLPCAAQVEALLWRRLFSSGEAPRRGWDKFYPRGKGRRPAGDAKPAGPAKGAPRCRRPPPRRCARTARRSPASPRAAAAQPHPACTLPRPPPAQRRARRRRARRAAAAAAAAAAPSRLKL